jgi:hypothetical protein
MRKEAGMRSTGEAGVPFCKGRETTKKGMALLTLTASSMVSCIALAAGPSLGETVQKRSEFVRVSLDQRETISGETLMVAAYLIIFVLFALYALSLYLRARAVERAALTLRRHIDTRLSADTIESQ